jgi:hypothetical protein
MKPNTDYYRRQAWFQLAQFGFNLASSKGGQSMTSAIATSAKEPMAAVAAIGAEKHKEERDVEKLSVAAALESKQALKAHKYKLEETRVEQIYKNLYPDKSAGGQYGFKLEEARTRHPWTEDPNNPGQTIWTLRDGTKESIIKEEYDARLYDEVNDERSTDEKVLERASTPSYVNAYGVHAYPVANLVVRLGMDPAEAFAKAQGISKKIDKKEAKNAGTGKNPPIQDQIDQAIAGNRDIEEIKNKLKQNGYDINDYNFSRE